MERMVHMTVASERRLGWPMSRLKRLSTGLGWPSERMGPQLQATYPQPPAVSRETTGQATATPEVEEAAALIWKCLADV